MTTKKDELLDMLHSGDDIGEELLEYALDNTDITIEGAVIETELNPAEFSIYEYDDVESGSPLEVCRKIRAELSIETRPEGRRPSPTVNDVATLRISVTATASPDALDVKTGYSIE